MNYFFSGIDVDVDVETKDKTPEGSDPKPQAEGEGWRKRCHGQGRRCHGGRGGEGCPRGRGGPGAMGPWGMWGWGMDGKCPPWMMAEGEDEKAKKKGKDKAEKEKKSPKADRKGTKADKKTPKEKEPLISNMEMDETKSAEKPPPSPMAVVSLLMFLKTVTSTSWYNYCSLFISAFGFCYNSNQKLKCKGYNDVL